MKNKSGLWAVVLLSSISSLIHAQNTSGKASEKEIQTVNLSGKRNLLKGKLTVWF